MSKEIIDLLEKYCEWCKANGGDCQASLDGCTIFEALTLLKQQPKAGVFTNLWRRKLDNAVALFKMGKSPDEWFQSIVTGFREACDIIDTAESRLKVKDNRILELESTIKAGGECCDILQERIDVLSEGKAKKEG